MVKSSTRRLKVFQARLGFYDTVVAAPSQAAALRAWGVHQNLFADGLARVTDDEQATNAALASPEIPLKRAVGSSDPFSLEPALPQVPKKPKSSRPKAPATPKAEQQPPKSRADRTPLDAAEAALRELDDRRKREEADLGRRMDELKAEQLQAQEAYVHARKDAARTVAEALKAYKKAGGL